MIKFIEVGRITLEVECLDPGLDIKGEDELDSQPYLSITLCFLTVVAKPSTA